MHPMPHSEAEAIAKSSVCAECGSALTVAWGGFWGIDGYVVRCGKDTTHEGVERVMTLTQAYRQGASLPLPIENRLDKRFGGKRMDSVALTKLEPKEMQERVVTASAQLGFSLDKNGMPKALTAKDITYLVTYCRDYGLDPMLGEVCLFHGRPYIMVDGLRRKAQETGRYAGLSLRPVTDEAEKVAAGYQPGDIVFQATAKRLMSNGHVAEFQRYGGVTEAEQKEMSRNDPKQHRYPVLWRKPSEMAQNRAERHAIRTAFHFEFPGVEEPPPIVTVEGTPDGSDEEPSAEDEKPIDADFKVLDESPVSEPTPDLPIDVLRNDAQPVEEADDLLGLFEEKETQPVKEETETEPQPELQVYRCLPTCQMRLEDGTCSGYDRMPPEWVIVPEESEPDQGYEVCPWFVQPPQKPTEVDWPTLRKLDGELRQAMMDQLARFGWDVKKNQEEIVAWIPDHFHGSYWRGLSYDDKKRAIALAKEEADKKEKEESNGRDAGTGKAGRAGKAQAGVQG